MFYNAKFTNKEITISTKDIYRAVSPHVKAEKFIENLAIIAGAASPRVYTTQVIYDRDPQTDKLAISINIRFNQFYFTLSDDEIYKVVGSHVETAKFIYIYLNVLNYKQDDVMDISFDRDDEYYEGNDSKENPWSIPKLLPRVRYSIPFLPDRTKED